MPNRRSRLFVYRILLASLALIFAIGAVVHASPRKAPSSLSRQAEKLLQTGKRRITTMEGLMQTKKRCTDAGGDAVSPPQVHSFDNVCCKANPDDDNACSGTTSCKANSVKCSFDGRIETVISDFYECMPCNAKPGAGGTVGQPQTQGLGN